jgi:hypothetical protein
MQAKNERGLGAPGVPATVGQHSIAGMNDSTATTHAWRYAGIGGVRDPMDCVDLLRDPWPVTRATAR